MHVAMETMSLNNRHIFQRENKKTEKCLSDCVKSAGTYSGTKCLYSFSSQAFFTIFHQRSKTLMSWQVHYFLLICLMFKHHMAVCFGCNILSESYGFIRSHTFFCYCFDLLSFSLICSDSLVRCQECQPVLPGCGSTGQLHLPLV